MIQKNAYYVNFNTEQFLAAKEILKSMPVFFNRIYFCRKYANALWAGDKDESFSNVSVLCKMEDITSIRQIIKNNFLHIADWDSLKFIEKGDYGFTFIGGNIKYVVIPFTFTDTGVHIMSYNADTGMCSDTDIKTDKNLFLDTSINEMGDFVRTCMYDPEDSTPENTKSAMAPKKVQPEMAVYQSNKGYAITGVYTSLIVLGLCMVFVGVLLYLLRVGAILP